MSLIKPEGRMKDLAKIRAEKRNNYSLLADIKEQALKESGPDGDRDPYVIHPSEMAKLDWCIRATFYRMSGKPEPDRGFNFVLENIFAEGHGTHAKFQRWMQNTGKLFGDWECMSCKLWLKNLHANELPVDGCHYDGLTSTHYDHIWEYKEVRLRVPGESIVGRADGAMVDTLAEFKTVGLGTLRVEAPNLLKKYYYKELGVYDLDRLWKELKRPLPGHIRQATIYLWLARELGLPYTRMTFIYEFKPNQQVKEFSITLSEDILEPMLAKARKIDNALKYNQPPACEFGGCKQCQAYEGGTDEGSTTQEPDERAGRRVVRRGQGNGAGEPGLGTGEAGGEATGTSGRADGDERASSDADVQPEQQVGRVRRVPASDGSGGRVVRRGAGGEAGSAPADPEQGWVSDGDESVRVGRRVVRRRPS